MGVRRPGLAEGFWQLASLEPSRIVFVDGSGRATTAGQMLHSAEAIAAALEQHPCAAIVGVIGDASETLAAYLAGMKMRRSFMPIPVALDRTMLRRVLPDLGVLWVDPLGLLGEPAGALPVEIGYGTGLLGWLDAPSSPNPAGVNAGDLIFVLRGHLGEYRAVRQLCAGESAESAASALALDARLFGLRPGHDHLVAGPLSSRTNFTFAARALHVGCTLRMLGSHKSLPTTEGAASIVVTPSMLTALTASADGSSLFGAVDVVIDAASDGERSLVRSAAAASLGCTVVGHCSGDAFGVDIFEPPGKVSPDGMVPLGFWRSALTRPDRPVLLDADDGFLLTASTVLQWANGVSTWLLSSGVRRGDVVAVIAGNEPLFFVAYLAALQVGAVLLPTSAEGPAEWVGRALRHAKPVAMVLGEAVPSAVVRMLGDSFDGPLLSPDAANDLRRTIAGGLLPNRTLGSVAHFTSGTTGVPRLIARRPPSVSIDSAGAVQGLLAELFGMPVGGTHYVAGCPAHPAPFGFAVAALHSENTLVLSRRWLPEDAVRRVDQHRVTSMFTTPATLRALVHAVEGSCSRVSSLKSVIHGTAPCPETVKRRALDVLGPIVWEYYATVEAVGTRISPAEWLERPTSVGRPMAGRDVVVIRDREAVPTGEVGDIGLLDRSMESSSHRTEGRVWRSRWGGTYRLVGDQGFLDADGYLHLVGRTSDVVIVGGVNVYPAEVENILASDRDVADAVAVGLPDNRWGERLYAGVVVGPLRDPVQAVRRMQRSLRDQLPVTKRPRNVVVLDEIPRTPAGKVDRPAARAAIECRLAERIASPENKPQDWE